jgi:hypothetical protein
MSWNYRIVKKESEDSLGYGVYEVYYDESGKAMLCTENPISMEEETLNGLEFVVSKIKIAINMPILRYEDFK